MNDYTKPPRWADPNNKLFPHQVGFTAPPHDFDAAPSDFLRLAPDTVGVHGRMLHVPVYNHELDQRADNFHLLEEVVHTFANNGANAVGQVGTNWVHAGGRDVHDIEAFCTRMAERYDTPLHMAGMTLVEACRALDIDRVALNSVYFWPDWRDGVVRFLRSADIDVVWAGNFVDQDLYDEQQVVNDNHWIFPGDYAVESSMRTMEHAPDAAALLINGMPNWRRPDGLPERTVHRVAEIETAIGVPVISSDFALYWSIFRSLGVMPDRAPGRLLGSLS